MGKKFLRAASLCAALTLSLVLAACGGDTEDPQAPETPTTSTQTVPANDPNLGVYYCLSVTMDDLDIGAEDQWVQLTTNGRAIVYLGGEPEDAAWTLSGIGLTLTLGGETLAAGTLSKGVMTLDMLGAEYVFAKDAALAPDPTVQQPQSQNEDPQTAETDQPPEGFAWLTPPGALCRVTYPTDAFLPASDGLTDLLGQGDLEGVKGWLARLTSAQTVAQWLVGLDAKSRDAAVTHWEALPIRILDQDLLAGIYQDASGWHADFIVDFGKDRGTLTYPMHGVCLTFTGPARDAVWNETTQAIAASLELTPAH